MISFSEFNFVTISGSPRKRAIFYQRVNETKTSSIYGASWKFKPKEHKPLIVNQQNVVYYFKCGLCDADYVGYTSRHLHQRVEEHKRSTIGNHVKEEHGKDPEIITSNFKILKKCQSKFDCLIFEMLFIHKLKPKLNKQCDSIRAKLFVWSFHFLIPFIVFRVFLSFTL